MGVILVPASRKTVVLNGIFSEQQYANLSRLEKKRQRDRVVALASVKKWQGNVVARSPSSSLYFNVRLTIR